MILRSRREPLADEAQRRVVRRMLVLVLAVVDDQFDRGVEQEGAEQEEDPAETVDRGSAHGDEDAAEDQRHDDADQQRELLQLAGHLEAAHDDQEDEQVVDRQAVLGEPAGEELAGVPRTRDRPDHQAEGDREPDEDADRPAGLLHRRLVGTAADDEDVEAEDQHHGDHGDDPGVQMDVHAGVSLSESGQRTCASRRSLPPADWPTTPGCAWGRTSGRPGTSVMTMTSRRNTPLRRPPYVRARTSS